MRGSLQTVNSRLRGRRPDLADYLAERGGCALKPDCGFIVAAHDGQRRECLEPAGDTEAPC